MNNRILNISFVVPCYNEMHSIKLTISEIVKSLEDLKIEYYEIIIIDDASKDMTRSIIKDEIKLNNKIKLLINENNLGLGGSVQKGFYEAKFENIMYLPGDNCHPSEEIKKMLKLENKYDLILSYYSNINVRPFLRNFFTNIYTPFLNFLFNLKLPYYNGICIYKKSILKNTKFKSNSFTWQIELLVQIFKKNKPNIIFVPTLLKERINDSSKAFRLKNSLLVVYSIIKLFIWNLKN
tara:strand:+ start:168 stop:878 length:711 start_codon:yes stop_codon:yes gene_type:complete